MRNWAKFANLQMFKKLRHEKGALIEAVDPDGGISIALPDTTINGLTAFAGGGQGSATPLTGMMNRVTTVATAADSVKLPAAVAGLTVVAVNAAAANAMNVFPNTGDSINALAANTALSVAANKAIVFFCVVSGIWHSVLTA